MAAAESIGAALERTATTIGDALLPAKLSAKMPANRRKHEAFIALKRERKEEKRRAMYAQAKKWILMKHKDILAGAVAFVPWIIQKAHAKGNLLNGDVVVHKGVGAVVFSDASGFTALTEKLAQKSNGAELLSQCLTAFFTPLIDIISSYRGDVIKFSGDALTIYFPAEMDPDLDENLPPCGTYGCKGHSAEELAVLRASACCIEIHRRLHMFDTGVGGVRLCLHIGVGFGDVTILQVGGLIPPETTSERYEYVICGPPMEQISIAEPLASNGETCLSPEAWSLISHTFEGTPVERKVDGEAKFDFIMLGELKSELHTFPVIKAAAIETDERSKYSFGPEQLDICRRYIPSAVFKQIAGGTLQYVNEMRNMSVIFINVQGVDVSTKQGSLTADTLMKGVQRCCNAHEGTLNKFLVDDKGMLFLLCFGLPPLVHTDDAIRAILCCMDIRKVMFKLDLVARFGVTTGRNYCGVVGSASRMEYTVLGDSVNLSARLMAGAKPQGILVGERTYELAKAELDFNILEKIKVKGKTALIPIFEPLRKKPKRLLGKCPVSGEIHLPWIVHSQFAGGANLLLNLKTNWREYIICQKMLRETELPVPKRNKTIANRQVADVDEIFEKRAQAGAVKHDTTVGAAALGLSDHQHDLLQGAHRQHPHLQTSDGKAIEKFEDPAVQIEKHKVFEKGGPVMLIGGFGLGKTELTEYVTSVAAKKFDLVPIVGSAGVRPGQLGRIFSDILRSICSAHRGLDNSLPADELSCLLKILPAAVSGAGNSTSGVLLAVVPTVTNPHRAPTTSSSAPPLPASNDLCLRFQKLVTDVMPALLGRPWISEEAEEQRLSQHLPQPEDDDPQTALDHYSQLTQLIILLTRDLLTQKEKSVLVSLRFERGTNLFTVTDDSTFWMVAGAFLDLYKALQRQSDVELAKCSSTLTIVCCIRDRKTVAGYERVVQSFAEEARLTGVWLDTEAFDEKLVGEYMAAELGCAVGKIPGQLIKYVSDITLGNPLFVREAMAMLQKYGHMTLLHPGDNSSSSEVECTCSDNLDEVVEVSGWPNTHMIGSILAVIESLDPLPASIVKMAAVFRSAWTMADILASACPPWSGHARYEALRQFLALTQLLEMDIVENVEKPTKGSDEQNSPNSGSLSPYSRRRSSTGVETVLLEGGKAIGGLVFGARSPTSNAAHLPQREQSSGGTYGQHLRVGFGAGGDQQTSHRSSSSSGGDQQTNPPRPSATTTTTTTSGSSNSLSPQHRRISAQPPNSSSNSASTTNIPFAGPFRLSNTLVRKVAGSMTLEAQKRGVKRQALMDRTLKKDLPARMEALRKKKAIPHIPWYYQIELPKVRSNGTKDVGDFGVNDKGEKIRNSKELARAQSQALLQNAEQLKSVAGKTQTETRTLLQEK